MYPNDLLYTPEHEWVKIDGDTATVGITHFAQRELGDIVFVDIHTLGKSLKKDDVFGTVEAVKTVSDLFMPLSGEILEINPDLENAPESVNNDPYASGWMVKIKIHNQDEVALLMDAAAYEATV